MSTISRRHFLGTVAAGAVIASAGLTATRQAMAADDVKFPANPKELQPGLESAHTPRISVEKTEARDVAYGKTPAGDFYKVTLQARHEATKEHHIFEIALFVNGVNVAQYEMNQGQAEATLPLVVSVQRLKAGDEVMAVTSCNIHGKWGNKQTV
jgi:desulfoferrodoxin (superoxide reductase-like protein)